MPLVHRFVGPLAVRIGAFLGLQGLCLKLFGAFPGPPVLGLSVGADLDSLLGAEARVFVQVTGVVGVLAAQDAVTA